MLDALVQGLGRFVAVVQAGHEVGQRGVGGMCRRCQKGLHQFAGAAGVALVVQGDVGKLQRELGLLGVAAAQRLQHGGRFLRAAQCRQSAHLDHRCLPQFWLDCERQRGLLQRGVGLVGAQQAQRQVVVHGGVAVEHTFKLPVQANSLHPELRLALLVGQRQQVLQLGSVHRV